jgi:hypothetical protein
MYMRWLVTKPGSKVMPKSPRSPAVSVDTVRKGVARSASFLMTRNWPFCWQTNNRPSGANSIAVGLAMPLAMTDSLKPEGRFAAEAATPVKNNKKPPNRAGLEFIRLSPWWLTNETGLCPMPEADTKKPQFPSLAFRYLHARRDWKSETLSHPKEFNIPGVNDGVLP